MVEITVADGRLIVEPRGLHRLWTLRRRIEVPLSYVRDARVEDEKPIGWWMGLRVPGTHLPWVIAAGTYYRKGRREFWDLRHHRRPVVIDLVGGGFDRLVVEVDDPDETVRRIEAARTAA